MKKRNSGNFRRYLKPGVFTAVFLLGMILFVMVLHAQQKQFNNYGAQKNELNAMISQEEKQLSQNEEAKPQQNSDEAMEELARELGWVKPNETIFVDISGK